ncbi:DUF4265 domain-containing protein [Kribbella sp. NBC_01245]|uniref:DUF4265 domain-containing protein n=1 Tax=Kribbella sp. NBC_01245 TaxID=2903578 RepID=UPI002E2CF4D9|nr:DUF4265 domain-containing protein [Kribbella sp. NBC_01245]
MAVVSRHHASESELPPPGHVGLLAGTGPSGRLVHEEVPAKRLADGAYQLTATPALVRGCAAGDIVQLTADGGFQVTSRDGNVAIQAFVDTEFTAGEIQHLTAAFEPLAGVVEAPTHRRFLVVTVPVRAGFEAIEAAMANWHAAVPTADWSFGNVFADDGTPLNWWHTG